MGLDTSHDAWHGAYSAFTRWRNKLAEVAGYAIWPVKFDMGINEIPMIDWGHLPEGALLGDWAEMPSDPLMILIAHSDCDGEIKAEHAAALADRLQEILPLLPEGDGGGHIGIWRDKTQTFINGCRAAAAANEPVDFH